MPFQLSRITEALASAGLLAEVRGPLPDSADDLTEDSRAVTAGSLFIAVRGSARDGHEFLEDAKAKGASAAIVEQPERTDLPALIVRDGRRAAAVAAAAAFEHPARGLEFVGVTGTNGKTTTVGILRHLLDAEQAPSASIGTLGVLLGSSGETIPGGAGLTTPGPVELQRVLRTLADLGVRRIAMEVSSHSLDQRRVEGLLFRVGVFTNFTRDHLDYHDSMESYFNAKARLISQLAPSR
jgi:UDP-N-acetylmuramoyl-L-alanyl-D-glutamate--2,6-diaminopimelate ligase